MSEAGLVPTVQCGEYLWWFFTNKAAQNTNGGMAYYHPEIMAAAQTALGRPLHRFEETTDDPSVNNARTQSSYGIGSGTTSRPSPRKSERRARYTLRIAVPVRRESPDASRSPPARRAAESLRQPSGRMGIKATCRSRPLQNRSPGLRSLVAAILISRELRSSSRSLLGWPRDSVRHLVPSSAQAMRGKRKSTWRRRGRQRHQLWAFDHVCIFGLPPTPEVGRSLRF